MYIPVYKEYIVEIELNARIAKCRLHPKAPSSNG